MLFEEAAERYMDNKRKRLRDCTLEGYASALRRHLHQRCDGVELPRRESYRPEIMDAGQVRGCLRALWGHECEAVAICSVTLGLRRGEACGLKWSDIDLRTGEVRVRLLHRLVGHERPVPA